MPWAPQSILHHSISEPEPPLNDLTSSRAAERLLKLARQNKGVYIKLAQHLSQMDYVLPEEYCDTLRQCLDDAPQSSYQDVCQVRVA